MKRSQFILLSAAGVAAIGTSYWYLNYYRSDHPKSINQPHALSLIWDSKMIDAMGQIYRKQLPEEDDEPTLRELLLKGETNERKAIDLLKTAIQNDFESGTTVLLDGWLLSKTEARQCALYSLTVYS